MTIWLDISRDRKREKRERHSRRQRRFLLFISYTITRRASLYTHIVRSERMCMTDHKRDWSLKGEQQHCMLLRAVSVLEKNISQECKRLNEKDSQRARRRANYVITAIKSTGESLLLPIFKEQSHISTYATQFVYFTSFAECFDKTSCVLTLINTRTHTHT